VRSIGRSVLLFLRLSRPIFLLGGALVYGLGTALAEFLAGEVDLTRYLIGQGLVTSGQLMAHYLNEYFDAPADRSNPNRTWWSGGSGALGPGGLPRRTALYAAMAGMVLVVLLVSVLGSRIPAVGWILLLLIFLGAFFYSVPPVRLIDTGYGELAASVLVAGLVPAFAFALQTGRLDRLVWLSTLPLVALHLAMILALELPDYPNDVEHGKRTLAVRVGWPSALRLHDLAIAAAVAFYLAGPALGFPRQVMLGAVIALPLAAAQVWQARRIRRGFRPRWRTFTFSAVALFALAAYLQLIGYLLG
jgi:1,4-dihydroxy-2-naphthoate octaprenyltransferase